jgi:hypothetical protein
VNGENLSNYFNYFTEIEEHFQRARGTSLFLLSPLDWALIETWKNSGVPLEAVLRGIDLAFEKWRSKKSRVQMVNSLAYCAQAVMQEAQRMADSGLQRDPQQDKTAGSAAFPIEDLRSFIQRNAASIRAAGAAEYVPVADALDQIITDLETLSNDLEALEQRLTMLEQKLVAIARVQQTEDQALRMRISLDSYLRPWRGKMTAPQIAMLEGQFLERSTLESAGLPRLSLFYLV